MNVVPASTCHCTATPLPFLLVDVSTITMDVFDLTGKKVATRTLAAQSASVNTFFDLGGLSPGAYVVSITAGKEHFMERLVVE